MLFANAVECLSVSLGLADLKIAADGSCSLRVGETGVALLPYPERRGMAFRAHVGNIAGDRLAQFMELLLAANLFEEGPMSSVLGMDPSADVYLAQHLREGAFGAPTLMVIFRRFVNRAQSWQQRLASPPPAPGRPPQLPGGLWP